MENDRKKISKKPSIFRNFAKNNERLGFFFGGWVFIAKLKHTNGVNVYFVVGGSNVK